MTRKRILVDALSVAGGGGRSYITNFLREIARDDRGFSFTVLALKGQLQDDDACGVRIEEVALPLGSYRARTFLRALYEQALLPLRARKFDLLYCLADVCPLLGSTPMVVLLRNLNIYDRTWDVSLRTSILFRLARAGALHARYAVFPTRAAADRICQEIAIPSERVQVVHYGIDPSAFRKTSPQGADRCSYLFVPAFPEPHKNIATAIRALPLLDDQSLALWIAGESKLVPEHKEELRQLARRLGVERRVRFLGAVPYREMLSYYTEARALVLPSFQETFGHPLLEGMLAGSPLIVSDIPAFRELADGVALFFPARDPARLSACVNRLAVESEATARRVQAGQDRAMRFTWKRSIDELCGIFDRALQSDASALSLRVPVE